MVDIVTAATQGLGVYTIAEAARYARMPAATLHAWFFRKTGRGPLRRSSVRCDDFRAISFLDFVEAVAIRSLRVDHGVSLQTIREALDNAERRLGIRHLLAHRDHRTVVVGRDIHVYLKDDPAHPVGLTGRDVGQKSFTTCIEAYMDDLEFNRKGLAQLYRVFSFKDQQVIMDPRIRFGEPVLATCGHTAETLWRAAVAEGSIERAAELYEVEADAVAAAYRYCNKELGLAA